MGRYSTRQRLITAAYILGSIRPIVDLSALPEDITQDDLQRVHQQIISMFFEHIYGRTKEAEAEFEAHMDFIDRFLRKISGQVEHIYKLEYLNKEIEQLFKRVKKKPTTGGQPKSQ